MPTLVAATKADKAPKATGETPTEILFDVVLIGIGDPEVTQEELPLADAIEFARQFNKMQYQGQDTDLRAIVVCRSPEPGAAMGFKVIEHIYDANGERLDEDEDEVTEEPWHIIEFDADDIPNAVFDVDDYVDDAEDLAAGYNRVAEAAGTGHRAEARKGKAPTLESLQAETEAASEAANNVWEVVITTEAGTELEVMRSGVCKNSAHAYAHGARQGLASNGDGEPKHRVIVRKAPPYEVVVYNGDDEEECAVRAENHKQATEQAEVFNMLSKESHSTRRAVVRVAATA